MAVEHLEALLQPPRCKRCNRVLGSDRSRKRGYGPTCWKKYQASLHPNLELHELAKQIKDIQKAIKKLQTLPPTFAPMPPTSPQLHDIPMPSTNPPLPTPSQPASNQAPKMGSPLKINGGITINGLGKSLKAIQGEVKEMMAKQRAKLDGDIRVVTRGFGKSKKPTPEQQTSQALDAMTQLQKQIKEET